MAEYRQHTNAKWIRTVIVDDLPSTKTVSSAVYSQKSVSPAGGVMTYGAASVSANTVSALLGTATAGGEYTTLVLITLDSGEIIDTTFVTEVYA